MFHLLVNKPSLSSNRVDPMTKGHQSSGFMIQYFQTLYRAHFWKQAYRCPEASSQGFDGVLQQIIRQMVEPLGYGQAQSSMEDVASLSGKSFGRLSEESQSRVG